MSMTARLRMHESYCSELGSRCIGVGSEQSARCKQFDDLLREVEAEAVAAARQKEVRT